MKIRIKKSIYRGRPVLSVFDLDVNEEYRDYPIITIGIRKAKAIVCAIDEIREFISKGEQNGKVHSSSKNL